MLHHLSQATSLLASGSTGTRFFAEIDSVQAQFLFQLLHGDKAIGQPLLVDLQHMMTTLILVVVVRLTIEPDEGRESIRQDPTPRKLYSMASTSTSACSGPIICSRCAPNRTSLY